MLLESWKTGLLAQPVREGPLDPQKRVDRTPVPRIRVDGRIKHTGERPWNPQEEKGVVELGCHGLGPATALNIPGKGPEKAPPAPEILGYFPLKSLAAGGEKSLGGKGGPIGAMDFLKLYRGFAPVPVEERHSYFRGSRFSTGFGLNLFYYRTYKEKGYWNYF